MLRVQLLRIEASYLRARCALAAASRDRGRLLAIARDEARRIAREKMRWSDPLASLLRAGIANMEGDTARAEQLLGAAVDGFDRAAMKLYAAAARRRLGILVGGERGRELVCRADNWMASQTIKNPPLMTGMLAPGFADEQSA